MKNLSLEEQRTMMGDIAKKHGERTELLQTKKEITALKNSNQMYNIEVDDKQKDGLSHSNYNFKSDCFDIILCDGFTDGAFAHEMKHAYQFEIGTLSTGLNKTGAPLYDKTDEIDAYQRGNLFGEPFDGILPGRYSQLPDNAINIDTFIKKRNYKPEDLPGFADRTSSAFRYQGVTYKTSRIKINE